MANTAFGHDATLTTPGSTTDTALVRWANTSGTSLNNTINILSDGSNITLNARGEVRFSDADSTHYIAFESPATVGTSYTMTLPADLPAADEVLTVTSYSGGAGVLEWAAAAGGAAITGTPVANQLAVWTSAAAIEGDAILTFGTQVAGSNANVLKLEGDFGDYANGALQIKTTHTSNTQGYPGISFYQNDNTLLATFRPGLTSNDSGSLSIGSVGNIYFAAGDPDANAVTSMRILATGDVAIYENNKVASITKGLAKGHLQWAANGTLQPNSNNVTSLSRTGTGQYTITWANDFDSADYQCVGSCQGGTDSMCVFSTPAAGTQLVEIYVNGSSTDSITNVAAFGDL